MSKLTLSVDSKVVARAKRYAKQRGESVSKIVETYLAEVGGAPRTVDTPILRSLRGLLKRADVDDYKKRIAVKYR
jgi:hypothetical protein